MPTKTNLVFLNKVLKTVKPFCTAHEKPVVIILNHKDYETLLNCIADAESYTGEPYSKVLDESIIIN